MKICDKTYGSTGLAVGAPFTVTLKGRSGLLELDSEYNLCEEATTELMEWLVKPLERTLKTVSK
jgi:hypothetical protein